MDVPLGGSIGYKLQSLEADSGFCGEQSCSSASSGPISAEQFQSMLFSYGSLGKRCLRSASTSLDHTNASRDSSLVLGNSSASADDCMLRGHPRSSKLGLAVILQLSHQQESDMEKFLLRHAALVEAAVGRARAGAEAAYSRPASFASLMYDIHTDTCRWFTDLLTGPTLPRYLWHSLSKETPSVTATPTLGSWQDLTKTRSETNLPKVNSVSEISGKRTKNYLFSTSSVEVNKSTFYDNNLRTNMNRSFSGLNHSDIIINKHSLCKISATPTSPQAENFIKELCELLESVDVKHTNFFISTLLTAVLTHHLGWVSTVCEPSNLEQELASKLPSSCNPHWGQLTDLYGAVGHPTRMSRTIVCGSNKADLITRILNMLTYFIRCSSIHRNNLGDFSLENLNIKETIQPRIIETNSSDNKISNRIPSFRDIDSNSSQKCEDFEMKTLKLPTSKTFLNVEGTLNKETKSENNIEDLKLNDSCKSKGLKTLRKNKSVFGNLCLQAESLSNNNLSQTLNYNNNTIEPVETVKIAKCSFDTNTVSTDVVFVLGDNEKLVGLKKSTSVVNDENKEEKDLLNIPSSSNSIKRPTELKLPTKVLFSCYSDSSPDCDSATSPCGDTCQTADLSPCSECEKMRARSGSLQSRIEHPKIVMTRSATIDLETEFGKDNEIRRREGFDRSQSVPPSDKKRKCGCQKKRLDLRQYPQIVENYMKSKYLELSQLNFGEKASTLNKSFPLFNNCVNNEIPACDCEPNSESLQTPSNASELEFTSDLDTDKYESHHSTSNNLTNVEIREDCDENSVNRNVEKMKHPLQKDNVIFEHGIENCKEKKDLRNVTSMVYVNLPLPG